MRLPALHERLQSCRSKTRLQGLDALQQRRVGGQPVCARDAVAEQHMGDFTGMHFLLRENVSIQLLRESYAGTGEIGFLCHARVDVVVPYPKAFAVITGLKVAA